MLGLLVALCIIAPIIPLFVNPFDGYDPVVVSMSDGVVQTRLAATAAVTGAALIWAAVLAVRGRSLNLEWPRVLWIALALFVASNVLALLFAEDWRASLMGERLRYQGLGATLLYVLLFAVAAFAVRTLDDLRFVIGGLFIGAVVAACYALVQKAGLDWITWAGRELDRPSSTVGQTNTFAAFLVLAINASAFLLPNTVVRWRGLAPWTAALALGWLAVVVFVVAGVPTGVGAIMGIALTIALAELAIAFGGPRPLIDTAIIAGMVAMGAALIFTISRSGYLAMFASLMIWGVAGVAWLMYVRRGRQPALRQVGAIAGGALALTVAAAFLLPLTVKGLDSAGVSFGRFGDRIEDSADFDSPEIATRRALWTLAWEMTLDRPLFGYGHDGFSIKFPQYRDRPDLPGAIRTESVDPESAHNFLLDLSSGTGLLGLLSFFLLAGAVFTFGVRKLLHEEDLTSRVAMLALISACAGYLVAIVLGFSEAITTWAFWLLLGAMGGLAARASTSAEGTERRQWMGIASRAAPPALVAIGVVALVWAGTFTAANLFSGQARAALDDGNAGAGLDLASRAVTLNPLERAYLLQKGDAYERNVIELGPEEAYGKAIETYQTAITRFEPESSAALDLALAKQRLYEATGVPVEEMYDDIEYAVQLDYFNTCLHRFVSDFYYLQGEMRKFFKHGLQIYYFAQVSVIPFCPSIIR